jgi:hypothetical protein
MLKKGDQVQPRRRANGAIETVSCYPIPDNQFGSGQLHGFLWQDNKIGVCVTDPFFVPWCAVIVELDGMRLIARVEHLQRPLQPPEPAIDADQAGGGVA